MFRGLALALEAWYPDDMEYVITAIFVLAFIFFITYKIVGAEPLFGAGIIAVAVGALVFHAIYS